MFVARRAIASISVRRPDQVADADARADGLGERRGVDDALGVHREHRRHRLAAEAQRHVGVVLEDREVVLGGQLQQRLALGQRQRVAGRVLEVGDDVRELRARAARAEQPRQRLRVDAVGLQLDGVQRRAALAQRQQRAVVGRALDDHVVAGAHEVLEQERVGLHRAVGHEHALGLHAVAVGDPGAQARVADRRAVGGRPGGVAVERARGRVAQALHVDDVERRRAAREGDRRSGGSWHGRVGYASEQLVVVVGQLARRALQAIAEAQQLGRARRAVGRAAAAGAPARAPALRRRRDGRCARRRRPAAVRSRSRGVRRRRVAPAGARRRRSSARRREPAATAVRARLVARPAALARRLVRAARRGRTASSTSLLAAAARRTARRLRRRASLRRACAGLVRERRRRPIAAEDAFELAQLALQLAQRVRDLLIHERQA